MQGYDQTRRLFHDLWRDGSLGTIDPADAVRRLGEVAAALDARGGASSPSNVPLHGDAHLRNMLMTNGQAVWIDWDDVCTGPIEWDIACLVVSIRDDESRAGDDRAVIAALGDEIDPRLLETMIDARNLQREVWDTAIRVLHNVDTPRENLFLRGAGAVRRWLGLR